jgi:hypothetical protein
MRKATVRSGLRFIAAGMIMVMLATFFPGTVASLLFLGMADEVRLTFLGFLLGGACGGWGVLVAAVGLLQTGSPADSRIPLMPSVMLLFSLVVLFFVLTYNFVTSTSSPQQQLEPGESINI